MPQNSHLAFLWIPNPAFQRQPFCLSLSLFSVKQSLPLEHQWATSGAVGPTNGRALLVSPLQYRMLAEKSSVPASILTCQCTFRCQLKLHHSCLYSAATTLSFTSFTRSHEVTGNSRNSALGQTYILYTSGLKLYSYF